MASRFVEAMKGAGDGAKQVARKYDEVGVAGAAAAMKGVDDGARQVARKYDELPTWGKVGVAGAAAALKGVGDGARQVARKYDEMPTWGKVGVAGAAAVTAVYFCLPAVASGAMMKAPGSGGMFIARTAFQANPKAYFAALRAAGAVVAVSVL